jgi:hypothetical protein
MKIKIIQNKNFSHEERGAYEYEFDVKKGELKRGAGRVISENSIGMPFDFIDDWKKGKLRFYQSSYYSIGDVLGILYSVYIGYVNKGKIKDTPIIREKIKKFFANPRNLEDIFPRDHVEEYLDKK